MVATDLIRKWRNSINYLGLPSVGIHVGWDIIAPTSNIDTFLGEEAWDVLYDCIPPWFKHPQTFRDLVTTKNSDYLQIVKEETENNKIGYYRTNGLLEPYFPVFSNLDRSFMILGDGNHRFLDCLYLIHSEAHNFKEDIKRASVDVIYLPNFVDILRPDLIWKENWTNDYCGLPER